MKILLIEDNEILSRNMVRFFSLKDIHVEVAFDGKNGLYKAKSTYYDAVILDISLPEIDGLEVCQKLRKAEKNVPIIMLTSRNTKKDIITGLDSGADDYLTKPFDYDELIARIKSLTRRNLKNKASKIEIGEYCLDLEKNEIRKKIINSFSLTKGTLVPLEGNDVGKTDRNIKLSNLEFKLFTYLAQNKGKVISRKELYEKVWGEFDGDFMFSKTVEVYIGYLRKKLGKEIIETIKGVGYIIK